MNYASLDPRKLYGAGLGPMDRQYMYMVGSCKALVCGFTMDDDDHLVTMTIVKTSSLNEWHQSYRRTATGDSSAGSIEGAGLCTLCV